MHIREYSTVRIKKIITPTFGIFFQTYVCGAAALQLEGFLQRALGLYTPNFLKRCAASFMDLLEHPISLLEHCFCLSELLFFLF